jgi:hypothetical protein
MPALEDVKSRLESLGIEINVNDDALINFSIEKITNHIKSQTNLKLIPQGLNEVAIDMVVGEFLFLKKSMGQLSIETIDFSAFAKQVQDGDTNVTFAVEANSTPEAKFDAMVDYLRGGDTNLKTYRVLSW